MKVLGYFKQSSFYKKQKDKIIQLDKFNKIQFAPIWSDDPDAELRTISTTAKHVLSPAGEPLSEVINYFEPVMLTKLNDEDWEYSFLTIGEDSVTEETVAAYLAEGGIITYEGHVYTIPLESSIEFNQVGVTRQIILDCLDALHSNDASDKNELILLIHHKRIVGIDFEKGKHATERNQLNSFLQQLEWYGDEVMPQSLSPKLQQLTQFY